MTQAYAKHDRVVLKAVESVDEVVGRIVTSDLGKNKANQYEIVSIGPGLINPISGQFIPTQYGIGETVFIHKVNTNQIEIEGEEFFVARDLDILCGLRENEEITEDLLSLLNGTVEDAR